MVLNGSKVLNTEGYATHLMGFGGRVNLWYQTVQQGNFFAASICPNSSFLEHLEVPWSVTL